MILFKPYVDLSKKEVDSVWIYTIHVTVFTNARIVGSPELVSAFSNSPSEGFFEATIGLEVEEVTAAFASSHVYSSTVQIELGAISFGGSNPSVLKVKLFDAVNEANLGLTIVHQDDVEEEGMPA